MNFIGGGFLASESQYTLATSWSFHSGLGAAVLYESAPEDEVPVGFGTHDKVTLRHLTGVSVSISFPELTPVGEKIR
jgi:hypothetical protein